MAFPAPHARMRLEGALGSTMIDVTTRRARLVLLAFSIGAVLAIVAIVEGALFAAANATGSPWLVSVLTVIVVGSIWAAFIYGAYRGLSSSRISLRAMFWMYVVFHVFVFPIGTAVSALLIWLWHTREVPVGVAGRV